MIIKIVLVVIVLIGIFLTYVANKPSSNGVSRQIRIAAPASRIFPYVNSRALANSWNPWLKQDPTATLTLSGPDTGVGSKTSWVGGKTLGTGSATVTQSVPNQSVTVQLDYQKPFVMTQEAMYLLEESDGQTTVTWKVSGQAAFLCKLMGTFMDMDKMVGDTFTKGLTELKTRVDSAH